MTGPLGITGIRSRTRLITLLSTLLSTAVTSAGAQYQTRTWLDWRTISTARFAVHFPEELEPWARSVASRMDAIDSTVAGLVGFSARKRVNVVIDDPFRISNGSAWPFLDKPALIFWATPPSPREDIGTFVTWGDMLATHEVAHLAHLTRPSRNPFVSALWNLLPVELGPIARKTPRWMIEGYATYLEGIVTRSGRPNGPWRPAILRQWAIEGVLPTYAQLNGTRGMYGGDFAYLGGSAFIEWLVEQRGGASLTDLWRRLSARRDRGFVEAFSGVYGESPAALYGRFTAELTAASMRPRSPELATDTGRVLQRLIGETGDPAISNDGGRVAIMLASETRPARIVIWSTLPEPDSALRRADAELLRADPEDVAPIRLFPPARRPLATLRAVGNQPYQGPRFFTDGRILVWRNAAIGDGSYAPDLFIWDPQRATVRRLTRGANIRMGDPSPDGQSVAALQCAGGHCDLVTVGARDGAIRVIAPGSDARSFYRPRYSRDGRTILASMLDGGFWRLVLVDAETGSVVVRTPGEANFFDASFADDSTIVVTSDVVGPPSILQLGVASGSARLITRVTGAAVGAEANPADGSIWFLALHARGWDLRSAPLRRSEATAGAMPSSGLSDRQAPDPRLLPRTAVGPTMPYGIGPRKWVYFPGGAGSSSDGASVIVGIANTDIVGRNELLILGQGGANASWNGATVSVTSRASPIALIASGFIARQDALLSSEQRGGAISLERTRRVETSLLRVAVGGVFSDLETTSTALGPAAGANAHGRRWIAHGSATVGRTVYVSDLRRSAQLTVAGAVGQSGPWTVRRESATLSIDGNGIPVSAAATAAWAQTQSMFERFSIGGLTPAILPPGVMTQVMAMPAIPSQTIVGKHAVTYRVSVPILGARGYSWGGRAWSDRLPGDRLPPWQRVHGVEWVSAIPQISTIGTPAARVTAGAGYWETTARRSRVQLYLLTQFGDLR